LRRRSLRNLLSTLLFASGVPMISSGDELGRSQGGNNNTYCQDNEISWLDWDLQPWQDDLLATTRFLAGLRAGSPVLGQRTFFTGRLAFPHAMSDFQWFAPDGRPVRGADWDDPHSRTLAMFLDGTHEGGTSLLVIFHGGASDAEVTLPAVDTRLGSPGEPTAYRLVWDSAQELPQAAGQAPRETGSVTLTAASVRVYSVDS
jgi:glycogen operon protein